MLNPIINATVAATSLSDFTKIVSKDLYDQAVKAKEKHDQHKFNPNEPIEVLRNKCISKICELQHKVVLCVTNADFLGKVMPLLLEHIANVYDADNVQEFRIIDMSLARIEDAVTSYKNDKKRRKRIRMWAVIVSLASLVGIGLFLWYGSTRLSITKDTTINILAIPVPVLLWSILGSFSAILYRFTNAGDKELNEPLRWLFARPLTGIIMGVISYLVLKVGLVSIQGASAGNGIANPEVIWLIAFLAGFSDRFSESLLRTVVGKFGGDNEGELVSMEIRTKSTTVETSGTFLDAMGDKTAVGGTEKEVDEKLLTDKPGAELPAGTPAEHLSSQTNLKQEETEVIVTETKTAPGTH